MPKLAKIYHFDSYGKRDEKYAQLDSWSITNTPWKELTLDESYYFFVPKDFGATKEYEKGFKINNLFQIWNSWVKTDRDNLFIDYEKEELSKRFIKLLSWIYDNNFIEEYNIKNSGSFKIIEKLKWKKFNTNKINVIQYRPFDYRYIYYDESLVSRPWFKVWEHIIKGNNISLITSRQFGWWEHFICYISKTLVEISSQPFAPYYQFPLYLYSDTETLDGQTRTPNLDATIWNQINQIVWETTPKQILDYIYAVLHSPTYRETYKEFLKIDFPRVPYPTERETFFALVKLGTELRELHLLESPKVQSFITTYPVVGTNEVEKVNFTLPQSPSAEGEANPSKQGELWRVYINETQYFWEVPKIAWEFYIGGYQPAQKWLKDRKGRTLTWQDIEHYQQMIVALTETARIMNEIDKVFKG